MSAYNLRTEDYFYCELCWTYTGRPNETMVVMDYPTNDGDPDDPVEIHFCRACLKKMLAMLEEKECA